MYSIIAFSPSFHHTGKSSGRIIRTRRRISIRGAGPGAIAGKLRPADAFFLFTVRIFDASLARANVKPKKVYCVDHALVRSVSSGILVNSGHLLENLVFTALRRTTPDVFYYWSRTGREVDCVARRPDGSRMLVQVCESLADPRSRHREVSALRDAMAELDLRSSVLVTRGELGDAGGEQRVTVDSGMIEVVPCWRFLLDPCSG